MSARALARAAQTAAVAQPLTLADLSACERHVLTNPLYVAPELHANGLIWSWQTTLHSQIREWVTLAAEEAHIQIAIDGDAVNLAAPLLDWRSQSGDTQLLAWTVCHEPLIELLRTLLQRDLAPVAIEDCDAPPLGDCVRMGFAIRKSDGSPVATGSLRMHASCIDRCVARTDVHIPRQGLRLEHVQAQLPIVIDEFLASPCELAAFTRGCIVRLDNRTLRTARPRIAIAAGHVRLVAEISDVRARVVALAASNNDCNHFPTGASMNDPTATQPPRSSIAAVDVDSLPVRLTFSAGRLMVPFGALTDVKAGYVFELDRPLNDQTIVIQANEVSIALGELVVLGDFLGVRITRMLPKA
jgi:flagellar motor switch/type III secretory pathway protein FliN